MTTAIMERLPVVSSPDALPSIRSIDLQFSTARDVDPGLEEAVAELIGVAAQDASCGILVTRLDAGRYTVTLDESVPFGETYEDIAA